MNLKVKAFVTVSAIALFGAAPASAEMWKDYSPGKGVWEVTTVKVDPNKIDDYLVGLKKSWVPGEEILKKNNVIDDYFVMVKQNSADGKGNVVLGEHYINYAIMDPNKARAATIKKETEAQMSKKASDAMVAGYDKYRTFVGDDYWQPVDFGK